MELVHRQIVQGQAKLRITQQWVAVFAPCLAGGPPKGQRHWHLHRLEAAHIVKPRLWLQPVILQEAERR
eukprot:9453404-Alexandrium_andersonii.AAC.1